MRISATIGVPKHVSRFNDKIAEQLHLSPFNGNLNDSIAFLKIFDTGGMFHKILCFGLLKE